MSSAYRVLIGLLLSSILLTAQSDWVVRMEGVGLVHVGMSMAQIRRVMKERGARLEGVPEMPLERCAYLMSKDLPQRLGLTFEKGKVVRINVFDRGVRTDSGIRVGDSEARVYEVYSRRITAAPHPTDAGGRYLTYTPEGPPKLPYRLLLETDGKTVSQFRIGTPDAVGLVEGCF